MKKKALIRFVSHGLSALALLSLTACVMAPVPAYQTYRYPYQSAYPAYPSAAVASAPVQGIQYGRIAHIEVIRTQTMGAAPSGVGALTGAVIGGVIGDQIGQGGGRAAATAIGWLVGSLQGNSIEAQANAPQIHDSYRIAIQTDNGAYRAFDVPSPGDLRVGDRVQIYNGQISRL